MGLKNIAEKFKGKRVLVYGDLILDHYIYGYAERISREAPIPILRFEGERYELGGAANAANNLVNLGAEVKVLGIVGEDREGEMLVSLLRERGIEAEVKREGRTLRKMRILAGGEFTKRQQVARVDWGQEFSGFFPEEEEDFHAAVISDYGYGTVSQEGFHRLKNTIPIVVVDSRSRLRKFAGATSATPNIPEFSALLGRRFMEVEEILKEGEGARRQLRLRALLVTLGNKGISLFEEGKPPFYQGPFGEDEVVDVSGAGDTVVATYTLAIASGASFRQAALLANIAGGISVMKEGASPVSLKEVLHGVEKWASSA